MNPKTKLNITGALFWAVLLGLIFAGSRCHADDREHERDDIPCESNVPEASTYTAAIVLGVGLVGFALWKQYRARISK